MGEAKSQNIIKYTQLLLSLSLCSFLFSPSSLLGFLHDFNSYFSSFTFQLFSHTIDKNCMFLLCNGLLVFVGITRSLSGSTPPDLDDEQEEDEACRHNIEAKEKKESEVKISEVDEEVEQEDIEMAIVEEEEEEEEGKGSGELGLKEKEEEGDEETGILEEAGDDDDDDDEEEEKMSENDEFLIEEKVVEEENWRLSTEEMNKKFDDFIRRMKEDLRIEAQR